MGIDELISPEELAASEIQLLLNQSAFNETHEFENGALIMVGISLPKSAPFVGNIGAGSSRHIPRASFYAYCHAEKGNAIHANPERRYGVQKWRSGLFYH